MATRAATRGDSGPGAGAFIGPWLPVVAVPVAGNILNWQLAATREATGWATLGLSLAGVALVATTFYYARPRDPFIKWHAATTAATSFLSLIVIMIADLTRTTGWATVLTLAVLAISWNVRRFEAIRGAGQDGHGSGADNLGIVVKSRKVIESTPDRTKVKLRLGDGQTAETVQAIAGKLGSNLGTIRRGVRAVPTEREGEVVVTAVMRDVLAETIPWTGPKHPGGSISEGIEIALYEDATPTVIYPAGNYEKNIAPGHIGQSGMSRSGKGADAHVIIAELCSRRDVHPLVLMDTRKGKQFTGPIEGAIGHYSPTDAQVRQTLRALVRIVVARNQALGECGYKSWVPACASDPRLLMGALPVWAEEAAAYIDNNTREFVELGEAALSAGVFLAISAQLWKHDRVPTSLRANIGNVIVFGCSSTDDASYLLSGELLAAGLDPGEWKTRHPGRCVVEGNGIDPQVAMQPAKGYFGTDELLSQVATHFGRVMLPYDAVTLAAWGEDYVPYEGRTRALLAGDGSDSAAGSSRTVVNGATLTQVTARMNELAVRDGDEDMSDEGIRETPEEAEGMYGMPEMDDAEMARMMAGIDPAEEVAPGFMGYPVDLSPEPVPGAREWSPEEKEVEFGAMLVDLATDKPGALWTFGELYELWLERLGSEAEAYKKHRLHDLLTEWIDERGQMERVKRGRYRILTLAQVGASAAHSE